MAAKTKEDWLRRANIPPGYGRHGGRHWRYFYKLYKEGKLEEEYDRVIGTQVFDRLRADGYIYDDSTIADFFSNFEI